MANNPSGLLPLEHGIGELRWFVTLYRREQLPGPHGAISETFVRLCKTWSNIVATYPTTLFMSVQTDTPTTHLIRLRWLDYVELTAVVICTVERRSDHTFRSDLYRVRRYKPIAGRMRFIELECEHERWATTTGDSDAERQLLFAEHPPHVGGPEPPDER